MMNTATIRRHMLVYEKNNSLYCMSNQIKGPKQDGQIQLRSTMAEAGEP
jgi:hypothetical protein